MNSLSSSPSTVHPLRRLLALGATALVLLLTVLAVSPQLHTGLHGHHHDCPAENTQDEGCVVTLFAAGVTAAPAPLVVVAPPPTHLRAEFSPHSEIFFSPPSYLHQPERGPPRV